MDATCDVIVIGAGHNGLTCAAYLARAGLSVKVFEARHVIGGATVTEEFHPGFRNSACAYFVSLLHPSIQRDLDLATHGLEILPLTADALSVLPGGDFLAMSFADDGPLIKTLEQFAPGDGAAYQEFHALLAESAALVRDLALQTPPNIAGGWPALIATAAQAWPVSKLSRAARQFLVKLFTTSAGDLLESWFRGDAIKGLLGYLSAVGNFQSPYALGTAYVLLHHCFGEATGVIGGWGHVRGGMGMIAEALARSAYQFNVEIEVNTPVAEVITDGGQARGVVLQDGRRVNARCVVSNTHPQILYERLLDPGLLPRELIRNISSYRSRSATFRMNVALAELPDFTARPGTHVQSHHQGSIQIVPSLQYLEAAYQDAVTVGWARQPVIEMAIPSTLDDSLSPPGQHVASLFCQHFAPVLPNGQPWTDVRETVADLIIKTINDYAPNFTRSVIARRLLSPQDLETEFHLVGGDIFHGALHLDQLYCLRPAPGFADYRTPVKGLYLCGSGAHPGGGVSGIPGRNAAREILRDVKRRRG